MVLPFQPQLTLKTQDLASEEAKGNNEKPVSGSASVHANESAKAAAKLAAKAGETKEESDIIQSLVLATLASGRESQDTEVEAVPPGAANEAGKTTTPKVLSKKERRQSAKAARDKEMMAVIVSRPTNSADKRKKRKQQRRKSSHFAPKQV